MNTATGTLFTPQKGRAPVPAILPGQFFVLEYNREGEAYSLHVDDADRSTYDLGADAAELQMLLRTRVAEVDGGALQPSKVDQLIDIAKEFGMAQYIPQVGGLVEDRVLPILPRDALHQTLKFKDNDEDQRWTHGLR